MILSDRSINEAIASGRLEIDPFDPMLVQPASVDVRLDSKILVFRNTQRAFIDVKQPADDLMEMIEFAPDEPMFLHPHEFVLGSTVERVKMPDDLVARLSGRKLGREKYHEQCEQAKKVLHIHHLEEASPGGKRAWYGTGGKLGYGGGCQFLLPSRFPHNRAACLQR